MMPRVLMPGQKILFLFLSLRIRFECFVYWAALIEDNGDIHHFLQINAISGLRDHPS